jgi:hypothetical protein
MAPGIDHIFMLRLRSPTTITQRLKVSVHYAFRRAQGVKEELDGSEYSVHAQDRMIGSEHYDLISLKSPRHQMWSLFTECKYDNWGIGVTRGTDFPRSGTSEAEDEQDFQIFLDHFVDNDTSDATTGPQFREITIIVAIIQPTISLGH